MSDDLIRRSDVYKAIDDWLERRVPNLNIKDIPCADRPQGEWVSNHDGSWNCSECGLRVLIYAKGNYCPNCGARMFAKDINVPNKEGMDDE